MPGVPSRERTQVAGDTLGVLPFLDIWDWHPLLVALFVFFIDFGVVTLLMIWPERRIRRPRYLSFLIGDTVLLPVFAGLAAWYLQQLPSSGQQFWNQGWFHWSVLLAGIAASVAFEVAAMKGGVFTIQQELAPSKLYHTLIFGVMVYWMGTAWVAMLATRQPWSVAAIGTVLLAGHVYLGLVVDARAGASKAREAHPPLRRGSITG